MVDSQLRLSIVNAIVVPKAFEQASDHSIIRAYTLNPEGRVMLKASSLLLSEVVKGIYDLRLSQPSDALTITATGNLIPYNQHKYPGQRQYYPSIMIVDEMSLMSGRVNIPIRVKQMMDEEVAAIHKVSNIPLYNGPLTSSTTIYPGSTPYYHILSGHSDSSQETDDTAHTTEATSKPDAFIFSGPSLKSDTSSRQGFKKFLDNASIFRKRTVDTPDDEYLKKARGYERPTWKPRNVPSVDSSKSQATNETTSDTGSKQHSHRLPRKASSVKRYTQ
ncbi:hypothetical protein FB192DRAFT_1356555 [Mucor lusitanicus]|nr:hypothetical protein FB192DRAFT_1356555 [Mucor lusitanicus]